MVMRARIQLIIGKVAWPLSIVLRMLMMVMMVMIVALMMIVALVVILMIVASGP